MTTQPQAEVTVLLDRIRKGDSSARDALFQVVYDELHAQAKRQMRRERDGHTLQTTALVHEAFLKLCSGAALGNAPSRGYFFGAAARAMQQVLVDHARAKVTQKRGGDCEKLPLDEMLDATAQAASPRPLSDDPADAITTVLSLNDALEKLMTMSERQHQVVMLRFFGGLTVPQVAEALGIAVATAEADFRLARAWLRTELG